MDNKTLIQWSEAYVVNDIPTFQAKGADARGIDPGIFGSQYPRLLHLGLHNWLVVYTISRNNGYLADEHGGNELEFARSDDNGKNWRFISRVSDPGRDLDNGQIIRLDNGNILLGCRSVIWQQSYQLPVYLSEDEGNTWRRISMMDQIEGGQGELGNPDRGVYEPHYYPLANGHLGVMYSSEKYALSSPRYSQVIIEKVSEDSGATWGEEIIVVKDNEKPDARPGMSIWTRLQNGSYIVVYEVIATERGDIFYKLSKDGIHWEQGIGQRIPGQKGGPYVLETSDGLLLVTSNTHKISFSNDNGITWDVDLISPWETLWGEPTDSGAVCVLENGNTWPSLYEADDKTIVAITSAGRACGGNRIELKFGTVNKNYRKG